MTGVVTDVFFYGLFMDASLLEAKGVRSTQSRLAVVRDWSLRIGQRATLIPDPNGAVHGVLMALTPADVDRLYAEESVRMYRPVAVLAEPTAGDAVVPALAYVLPEPPAPDERNPEYATRLRALAERLGLPEGYTQSIS